MNVSSCLSRMCQFTSNCLFSFRKYSVLNEKVKEASQEIFSMMLPQTFFYTFNQANRYPFLRDIIGGTGCTMTGIYMMYKSYCAGKFQGEETSSQAAIRRTCALLGFIGTAYGLYTLGDFMSKVLFNLEGKNFPIPEQLHSLDPIVCYGGTSQTADSAGQARDQAGQNSDPKQFLRLFLSCSKADDVYLSINKQGPISIRFEDPAQDELIAQAHGYWNMEKREIVIDRTSPDLQKFHILIYEMLNASQSETFEAIYEAAARDLLGDEEYAKYVEEYEYNTTKMHCHLTAECRENGSWPFLPLGISSQACHEKYQEDFDTRWERIKDTPHAQIYRDKYRELFPFNRVSLKQPFCRDGSDST